MLLAALYKIEARQSDANLLMLAMQINNTDGMLSIAYLTVESSFG